MSTEEPPARLVEKTQYWWITGKRALYYLSGTALACLGLVGIVWFLRKTGILADQCVARGVLESSGVVLMPTLLVGLEILVWMTAGAIFFEAEKIKPVVRITRHNSGSLPEAETLVRSSDSPPTDPHELLRATRCGSDVPAQEMLRAAPGE